MSRIKVLFLAANTDPDARLELEKEYEQIRRYMEVTPEWDALQIVYEPSITANSLLQLFEREQPDIVHVAAHADREGRIKLYKAGGTAVGRVTPQALGQLFEATTAKVKLVVFNACYSKPAADAVSQHVPFRIGTKGEIEDAVAIQFSSFFYQGLGFGRTVWDSYKYARAGVALTLGEIPPDQIAELDESSSAAANDFRLKSPRIVEMEQAHRREIEHLNAVHNEGISQLKGEHTEAVNRTWQSVKFWSKIGIPVIAAISILGAVLLFPKLGWEMPGAARQHAETAKANDEAIAALAATETFFKNEINDLGGDTTPPVGYPPDTLRLMVNTSTDEMVPQIIKEPTRKEAEQGAMNEWRNDILTHTRGAKEELLVVRSKDDFKPPYKSCSYILKVATSVRLTRAAAFLVRDGVDATVYRPTYRQMKFRFIPDRDREGTLALVRPRRGESLLIYLWVRSVPTDEKLVLKGKPWAFFDVILTDMEPIQ